MLQQAIRRYQNRAIETAQVIEELIELAKDMQTAAERGEQLNFNEDELAFYDALSDNESAVDVIGDETLRTIARELVERVRAQLRVIVEPILRKYGYPPDLQEQATDTVLEQAALLSSEWAVA